MANPTEDTVNDLMRDYLQNHDFSIISQKSYQTEHGRKQPDITFEEGGTFHGEGEWQNKYTQGITEAIDYGDIPGASGYFVIGYQEGLRDSIEQQRLGSTDPETLLSGHTYRGLFKVRDGETSNFKGSLEEIPEWIRNALQDEPKKDPEEYIALMRDMVDEVTDYIPSSEDHPSLFTNIFPDLEEEGGTAAARDVAGYVLLNQIVFYHILEDYGYQGIDWRALSHPAELDNKYFNKLPEGAYDPIFEMDVASLVEKSGLSHVKDMVRIVDNVSPKDFTRDLLGNVFHELIPLDIRKHVAAYYTNPMAARLLANLSVHSDDAKVADLACGSGSLLMGAYERKSDLLRGDITEDVHEEFINKELTGIDIMPFAAHLATVQLALRNPGYDTNKTRIGIDDSTTLEPGETITPQQRSLRLGQSQITQGWSEEDLEEESVQTGSTSGYKFELDEVDTVIMNPPFTRKQKITSDYRSELRRKWLSDYTDYIDDEMGYYGYFVPLADKFLKEKDESRHSDGARMAMVIPAVVLQQTSLSGIREFFQDKYTIEHIVFTQHRSAFSEDTSYRDILLVARKDPDGDDPVRISSLDVMPEGENLGDLVEGLTKDIDTKYENGRLQTVERPQSDFRDNLDWMSIVREHVDVEFFYEYPDTSKFAPFQDQIDSMIGGIRLHDSSDKLHPENSLISQERDANVHTDWKITNKNSRGYAVQSQTTGAEVKVPFDSLDPALRSFSGMRTMEINEAPDYVVTDQFPGDDTFWMDANPDEILEKRRRHIDKRKCQLILAGYGNIDLTAPGTSHLALSSEEETSPTWTMWSVGVDSWEDAKLLTLWWNSTFSIAKLITERNEVRGGVVKWRKGDLTEFLVPDLNSLSDDEKQALFDVYNEVADVEFPALVHQFAEGFESRKKIDKAWSDVLGWEYDDDQLEVLYSQIDGFLSDMKEMMGED